MRLSEQDSEELQQRLMQKFMNSSNNTGYSPMPRLLEMARSKRGNVRPNPNNNYTALWKSHRNRCFTFKNHPQTVVFKLPSKDMAKIFAPTGMTVVIVQDGKKYWPAVKFTSDLQVDACSEQINEIFNRIF